MLTQILIATVGIIIVVVALWDGFETIVLPRRVARRVRPTRLFYRTTWFCWSFFARRLVSPRSREGYLSFFGPLSLIVLLAVWAVGLVTGFGLLMWAFGPAVAGTSGDDSIGTVLYMSGTNFFTLGLGDVTPRTPWGRLLTVVEVGTGFGFLALVIGYLPVLYQAFSRREVNVSMLDERAGSPPSAVELLRRVGYTGDAAAIGPVLAEWERWAAELMETHLSYPILAYYRSQHDNQSWVAALTTMLDVSALVTVGVENAPAQPARLTFAMARHCAVDLSQVFGAPPSELPYDRLPRSELVRMRAALAEAGVPLREGQEAEEQLANLRQEYEPYVFALSKYLLMPLPSWLPPQEARDNWQMTPYGLR